MNIYKSALSMTACVAAVSLSACTPSVPAQPAPTSAVAAPSLPLPTSTPPPSRPSGPYDEWQYWTTGTTTPKLTAAAPLLGLANLEVPQKEYLDLGYIGTTKLGSHCVVGILGEGSDAITRVTVAIFSRYNVSLNVARTHMTPDDAKQYIASYKPQCSQEPGTKAA